MHNGRNRSMIANGRLEGDYFMFYSNLFELIFEYNLKRNIIIIIVTV